MSNKQPNLTPKAIRERRTKKLQRGQKERNHKVCGVKVKDMVSGEEFDEIGRASCRERVSSPV